MLCSNNSESPDGFYKTFGRRQTGEGAGDDETVHTN